MEEDTGKSLHVGGATGRIHGADHSLLDYNRSGVPLIEIVTKPIEGTGAKAPEVARAYVAMLRDLLRALGVSDVRMEQGSLRCDANVSLRPIAGRRRWAPGPRPRTSTRCAASSGRCATRSPGRRRCWPAAARIKQETRHWQEDSGTTSPGRSKEQAEDYRYFPEPDLVPVAPSREWVEELRGTLPEPPVDAAEADERGVGLLRAGDARRDQRRRGECDRGDGGGRRLAAVGPQVVADRGGPAGQRDRRRSRGRRGHPGAGGRDPGPGRGRHDQRQAGPLRCSRA